MYFQNFLGSLQPKPLPNGTRGWTVPMDPSTPALHAGDVAEVGNTMQWFEGYT